MTDGVESLNDGEVVATLQELTSALRPTLTSEQQAAITSNEEALLAALTIAGADADQVSIRTLNVGPVRAAAAARALLEVAVADAQLVDATRPLVDSPPSDDQMFLAGGLEIVVVLAALVTILQTKLDLRVSRKKGQVDFDFQLSKAQASDATVQKVIAVASDLLKGS